jgi:predicted metal-binding protein
LPLLYCLSESGEPNAAVGVHQNVCGTQFSVDKTLAMQTTECSCYCSRELKAVLELQGPTEFLLENITPWVR